MIQIYSIWEKYFYISVYQSSKLVFIRFILLMNENSSSWGKTMKTTNIKSESVLATDADRGRMHGAGIFL